MILLTPHPLQLDTSPLYLVIWQINVFCKASAEEEGYPLFIHQPLLLIPFYDTTAYGLFKESQFAMIRTFNRESLFRGGGNH